MRKRVLFLIIAFLVFMSLIGILRLFLRPRTMSEVTVLNDKWMVNYNGTEYSDVKLSELRQILGHSGHRGDKIVLSRMLEGIDDISTPTVFFETMFSAYKLSFCGQEIISLYYDRLETGQFIGSDYNYIQLPKISDPGLLEIELVPAEDDAYNYYRAPIFDS